MDVVYVATPVFLHAPQTIASLQAGKHVLCEKPVAMDYTQASEMVRVAREADRVLGVAYYRRTYPKVQRARELANEVKARNQEAELEPLPAHERRIIHTALADDPDVSTYSEGDEPHRRVIISPRK